MKVPEEYKVKFCSHGHNAPAYGCSKPGDQSGYYVHIHLLEEAYSKIEVLEFSRRRISEQINRIHEETFGGER